MRPFVKEVRSNVKSPVGDWVCELGRHNLILGPNRSHKTTIIQALELGASGSVDDLMGRDGVKTGEFILTLKPESADSVHSRVTYTDSSQSEFSCSHGSRPVTTNTRPSMVVSRLTKKVMSGSAAKLHEAMLDWMDFSNVSVEEVVDLLPKDYQAKYLDIADRMRRSQKSEVHILQKVIEYAAKTQREKSTELKFINSMKDSLSDRLTPSDVTDEEMNEIVFREVLEVLDTLTHMEKALDYGVDRSMDNCPSCSSPVGLSHLKLCKDHISSQITKENKLNSSGMSRIMRAARSRIQWRQFNELLEKSNFLKVDVATYKGLKDACTSALSSLVTKYASDFCAHVDKYLPPQWNLKYDTDLKVLGLDRGQRGFHSSLSGAEWATVVTAVACAASDSIDPTEPILLVVDDRAWDSETLAEVMKGLGKFQGQVVIQSTVKPKGRMSSDWNVVSSDDFLSQFGIKKKKTATRKKRITKMQKNMLTALGFKDDDIKGMNYESAQEITSKGVAAANVDLHDDGSWSMKEGGNLRVMPRKD